MIKGMVMVKFLGQVAKFMRVIGKITEEMVRAHSLHPMAKNM